jgi:hypothetical protein
MFGLLELGHRPRFAIEALRDLAILAKVAMNDLHRDLATRNRRSRAPVHRGHAAVAYFLQQRRTWRDLGRCSAGRDSETPS